MVECGHGNRTPRPAPFRLASTATDGACPTSVDRISWAPGAALDSLRLALS